jgi:hypothetical protein
MRSDVPGVRLGVSVKGEDALVVASVMAAGVGDVGVSGAAERTGDEVADASHRVGLVPGAHLLLVFAECDVADIMLTVFDAPVLAGVPGEVTRAGQARGQAGDAVDDLLAGPRAVRGPGVTADPQDLGRVRPVDPGRWRGADGTPLAAAVAGIFFGPGQVREPGVRVGQGGGDGLEQRRLVRLYRACFTLLLLPVVACQTVQRGRI